MENLDKALSAKKLEDLVAEVPAKEPNLLEPTQAEIEQIITLLKEGKSYKEIRMEVRRVEEEERTRMVQKEREATRKVPNPEYNAETNPDVDQEIDETYMEQYEEEEAYQFQLSAKGFSYGQIKEIELGMKAKIVKLTFIEEVLPNLK